jgi:glutamyl/glutaminyl-tRNA synthetase
VQSPAAGDWPIGEGIRMLSRFAPAPTGLLHLGHVVNAIYVWGLTGAAAGQVLLRVEDHDRQRCRPEFESALLDDLDWLGFRPDVFPTDAFRAGRCAGRQSDRDSIYRGALAPLIGHGLVFACDCTRKQLTAPIYNGRCRDRGLRLVDGVGWRIRLDDRVGGDVLIRDRRGNWTYQWAVSVDDTVQGISHVIRGNDLRDSTDRQIALAALLGRADAPAFFHHPLVMKSPMQKLSKSDGDSGIADLRAQGWTAAMVIGHAASLVNLQSTNAPVAAAAVSRFFS